MFIEDIFEALDNIKRKLVDIHDTLYEDWDAAADYLADARWDLLSLIEQFKDAEKELEQAQAQEQEGLKPQDDIQPIV